MIGLRLLFKWLVGFHRTDTIGWGIWPKQASREKLKMAGID